MTPQQTATVVLVALAAVLAGGVIVHCRRSDGGWRGALLFFTERLYIGLGFRMRTNGRCPFPAEGGALIVCNHRSALDPLLLWQNNHLRKSGTGRFRIISFLMAAEYANINPLIAFICTTMRSIPVARDGKDMAPVRETVRLLRRGELVGIFPEGGINTGPGLRPADTGVAWLALTGNVPVIPVFIHNSPQVESLSRTFFTFQPVRVVYGETIDLSEYEGQKKSHEVLNEVTVKIMTAIGELGGVDMTGYHCLEEE